MFSKKVSGLFGSLAVFMGFAAAASAADLDGLVVKAPPPLPDLTWHGITLFGAIDIAGQYESKGAPYNGNIYTSSSMIAPPNRSPQWVLAPNQSLQSFVGLRVDENITADLKAIARLEIGFNPTTGEISDALKGVQKQNGLPAAQQAFNSDGSRAGQIFNGEAWGGFDSKTWGAIHVGRNNTVSLDMLGAYDPLASYGFSLLGYVGFLVGEGSPDTARIDSSIKYLKTFGPFRTEILYGRPNTNAKDFFQATIGYVQPNFSVDFIGGHATDIVSVFALAGPANLGSSFLGARIFNADMYGGFAKYVFDVGGYGPLNTSESKFTISGGYQRLDFSNPTDGGWAPGHETIGGYQLGPAFSVNASPTTGIVNYAFTGQDRLMDIAFGAGKYQYDSQLSFALGYYYIHSNSFGFGVSNLSGIVAPTYSRTKCSSSSFANCSGSEQAVSFRTDYQWTKNLMLYGGITYSEVKDGMAFGFLSKSTWAPTVGARLTF